MCYYITSFNQLHGLFNTSITELKVKSSSCLSVIFRDTIHITTLRVSKKAFNKKTRIIKNQMKQNKNLKLPVRVRFLTNSMEST
jgi:hypothetical protein